MKAIGSIKPEKVAVTSGEPSVIELGNINQLAAPDAKGIDLKSFTVEEKKPEKILPFEENAIYVKYKNEKGKTKTERIVIEGTKVLYFRNGLFDGFPYARAIPLNELLKVPAGMIHEKSGEQLLAGFLVAALDDEQFVVEHFDEFDATTIEKIVEILVRLNGIAKKEEEQEAKKQKAAQEKKA